MTTLPCRVAPPYRSVAADYDEALGSDFFRRVRRAFERLRLEYGFGFRSVADIGCGTGLFARYLARRFRVRVYAVDRSPDMLRQAMNNCRMECITFLKQDLRQLSLPHPVDLITANYDVLNHLLAPADLRQVLQRVRSNLNPGGHFYFDIITPCLSLPPGMWTTWDRPTFRGLMRQLLLWEPGQRLLQINVLCRRVDRRNAELERHVERAYTPAQIASWLAETGFSLRAVHDEATAEPAQQCSPRMLFLAQRPVRGQLSIR